MPRGGSSALVISHPNQINLRTGLFFLLILMYTWASGSVAACLTPRTLLLGCRRPATNCQACHHFHLSVQYSVAPLDGSPLLSIVGAREDLVRLAVGGEDEGDVGLDVGVRVSRR